MLTDVWDKGIGLRIPNPCFTQFQLAKKGKIKAARQFSTGAAWLVLCCCVLLKCPYQAKRRDLILCIVYIFHHFAVIGRCGGIGVQVTQEYGRDHGDQCDQAGIDDKLFHNGYF